MTVRPLADRLVVEPITEDEITKAGIILPDTVDRERPEKWKVIAVGTGKRLDNGERAPLEVKVGDIVVFKKYSPDEVKIDNVEYLVVAESDIMAVIE